MTTFTKTVTAPLDTALPVVTGSLGTSGKTADGGGTHYAGKTGKK